jgi:penicillin-binding protein 2
MYKQLLKYGKITLLAWDMGINSELISGRKPRFYSNSKTYDKAYRKKWNSNTIISIAIGQGEILASPLQICNVAATIANKGYFYTPHVVKKIQDMALDTLYTRKRHTTIEPKYYEIIAEGMRAAVTSGTCRLAAIPDIEVCGKTGTVEIREEKITLYLWGLLLIMIQK